MTENDGSGPGQPGSGEAPQAGKDRARGAGRVFLDNLQKTALFQPEEWPLRSLVVTAFVIAAFLSAIAVMRHGFAHVKESEVGVLIDNVGDEMILKDRVGYHFFVPYLASFEELDKTIQKLSLTWDQGPGARTGRDVKLKTADGNNVSLDVTINYKLIPEMAKLILRDTGTGTRFTEIWVEPFARHCCLAAFGQLKTEEMYDAGRRNEMAQLALKAMNEYLKPHGIEVIALIPGEFRFYREYEQIIQQKKLADQQVEEQQAQGRAALEDTERQLIETRRKIETRVTTFNGECSNRLMQAQADAERVKREAEGQNRVALLNADSALYSTTRQAEGKRAQLFAEATGVEKMRESMAGDGGRAMVEMEYARHLDKIRFAATPVTRQPTIQQFSMQPAEAAATQGGGR